MRLSLGSLATLLILTAGLPQAHAAEANAPPVVAVATSATPTASADPANKPELSLFPRYEPELREDVVYGTGGGEQLLLHLARPVGAPTPAPAIVLIHGGGWSMGTRHDFREEMLHFARHGAVAVSVDYRLAPTYRWPAQIEDCKCAVRWLRAHAAELGLDPQRIGAIGGSAGGHLSQLLGVMDEKDGHEGAGGWSEFSSRVQAVVNFCGPADMVAEFQHQERNRGIASLIARQELKVVTDFLGGTPEEVPDAYRAATPLTYVSHGDAPTLILHGTHDFLVPYQQMVKLAGALGRANVHGRLELVFGNGHGWEGEELARTRQRALEFFAAHLAPRP